MDSEFNSMVPCRSDLSLEEVKTARKNQLFTHFEENRPDIFITELYPFGRKAFKFELDPLLEAIRDGSLPSCSCYCSVRDILVEKTTGREKFEQRATQTANSYFKGILVHADPELLHSMRLLAEWLIFTSLCIIPVLSPKPPPGETGNGSGDKLALSPADKLIVASIGGGNVGSELLYAVTMAFKIMAESISAHLQLFCGPYCDEKVYQSLQNNVQDEYHH